MDGRYQSKAVYTVLTLNLEGKKEVLGLYLSESEGANFWLSVLSNLQNRGVEDILIACVDELTGFPDAINSIYSQTEVQLCIVQGLPRSWWEGSKDHIQLTDAPQRFGGDVGRRPDVNVVDFSPGVRHAGRFRYAVIFVQGIVATVGIRLQDTAVPGKMLLWMHAFPVRRVTGVTVATACLMINLIPARTLAGRKVIRLIVFTSFVREDVSGSCRRTYC